MKESEQETTLGGADSWNLAYDLYFKQRIQFIHSVGDASDSGTTSLTPLVWIGWL